MRFVFTPNERYQNYTDRNQNVQVTLVDTWASYVINVFNSILLFWIFLRRDDGFVKRFTEQVEKKPPFVWVIILHTVSINKV